MEKWESIKSHIDDYPSIYTESSLDAKDHVYQQEFIFLPDPSIRSHFVADHRWHKMRNTFLKYYNLDIHHMAHVRPLFILSAIQQVIAGQSGGVSLDQRIWNYALANNKEVNGIETAQEQVEILLQLPLEDQYRHLVRFSKKISGHKSKLDKIITTYVDQNITQLYKLSKKSLGFNRNLLLQDRNQKMSERILAYHQQKSCFFSFGAGHLAGYKGILNILKKSGAHIAPVKL